MHTRGFALISQTHMQIERKIFEVLIGRNERSGNRAEKNITDEYTHIAQDAKTKWETKDGVRR